MLARNAFEKMSGVDKKTIVEKKSIVEKMTIVENCWGKKQEMSKKYEK